MSRRAHFARCTNSVRRFERQRREGAPQDEADIVRPPDHGRVDREALVGHAGDVRRQDRRFHIHHREDEAWYVLDGQMTFYVGDLVLEATSGSFAYAPSRIPHTFTVDVEPTRVLVFASPSGFEHFALELGEPAAGDVPPAGLAIPDPADLEPVARRFGIEVVGPPRRVLEESPLPAALLSEPVPCGRPEPS